MVELHRGDEFLPSGEGGEEESEIGGGGLSGEEGEETVSWIVGFVVELGIGDERRSSVFTEGIGGGGRLGLVVGEDVLVELIEGVVGEGVDQGSGLDLGIADDLAGEGVDVDVEVGVGDGEVVVELEEVLVEDSAVRGNVGIDEFEVFGGMESGDEGLGGVVSVAEGGIVEIEASEGARDRVGVEGGEGGGGVAEGVVRRGEVGPEVD